MHNFQVLESDSETHSFPNEKYQVSNELFDGVKGGQMWDSRAGKFATLQLSC